MGLIRFFFFFFFFVLDDSRVVLASFSGISGWFCMVRGWRYVVLNNFLRWLWIVLGWLQVVLNYSKMILNVSGEVLDSFRVVQNTASTWWSAPPPLAHLKADQSETLVRSLL